MESPHGIDVRLTCRCPSVLTKIVNREVVVSTEDGQSVRVPKGSDKLSQRTPPALEAAEDLSALPDLNEPNMLHSLHLRYLQDKIYTRTGPILVALNPWQRLDHLYGPEVLQSYRGKHIDSSPPHVYAIAEAAYANLRKQNKAQTILVSGDSGSGKTESTKIMMHYLASVASHTTSDTEQQVLQCNPILEAFGNAKTLRNDNSSRFGKYIDIHFNRSFAMCGAKIDTYLLEKSRVVAQENGERNFHVFYQLCAHAERETSNALGLRGADHYEFVKKGHGVAVVHQAANSFEGTQQAMLKIGITQAECDEIFNVLGAILHLGNVTTQDDASEQAVVAADSDAVSWSSQLLGVGEDALATALTTRSIQAGTEGFTVKQTAKKARETRDALARALYSNLFEALVGRINASLCEKDAEEVSTMISILDIFGFEHFETNHFEQFCINYANEKLQGHFNEFNFSLEIEEYKRENIPWSFSDFHFQSNAQCIELIEGRHTGVLALLDEQCIVPNGNDAAFCTRLRQHTQAGSHLGVKNMQTTHFSVKHYASDVCYDAREFCFKNKDPVQPSMVELMSTSSSTFVRSIFARHKETLEVSTPQARGSFNLKGSFKKKMGQSTLFFESVSAQFKRQLADLMRRIASAQPHFIRCINPNAEKKARSLEPCSTLDQLRCSGLMEAVRVSRAGFPVRLQHGDFVQRYTILLSPPEGLEERAQAMDMCRQLELPDEHFRMGNTKVFMRRQLHEQLEAARAARLLKDARTIQRVFRGHLARRRVHQLRQLRAASPAPALAGCFKRALVQRWYVDALTRARQRRLAKPGAQQPPHPASRLAATPPRAAAISAAPSRSSSASSGLEQGATASTGMMDVQALNEQLEVLERQRESVWELYSVERAEHLTMGKLLHELALTSSVDGVQRKICAVHRMLKAQANVDGSEDVRRRSEALHALLGLLHHRATLLQQAHQTDEREPCEHAAFSFDALQPAAMPHFRRPDAPRSAGPVSAASAAGLAEHIATVERDLQRVRESYYTERAANIELVQAMRELPLLQRPEDALQHAEDGDGGRVSEARHAMRLLLQEKAALLREIQLDLSQTSTAEASDASSTGSFRTPSECGLRAASPFGSDRFLRASSPFGSDRLVRASSPCGSEHSVGTQHTVDTHCSKRNVLRLRAMRVKESMVVQTTSRVPSQSGQWVDITEQHRITLPDKLVQLSDQEGALCMCDQCDFKGSFRECVDHQRSCEGVHRPLGSVRHVITPTPSAHSPAPLVPSLGLQQLAWAAPTGLPQQPQSQQEAAGPHQGIAAPAALHVRIVAC